LAPDPGEDRPDLAGVVVLPARGGEALLRVREGTAGATALEVPAGEWVLSVEAWSPVGRRAGRHREGLRLDPLPRDLPTLSDLLLLRPGSPDPSSLDDLLPHALERARVPVGEGLGVAWEVTGVGWEPGALDFEVTLERVGGGVLRRAGEWLGVLGRERPVALAWQEPAPEGPRPLLRRVDLTPGPLPTGRYRVRVGVRLPGRAPLSSAAYFDVVEGGDPRGPGSGSD